MDEEQMLVEFGPMLDGMATNLYHRAHAMTDRESGWLTPDDFAQEARLCAVVAIRMWDPAKGSRLRAHVAITVKRRMVDWLRHLGFDARGEGDRGDSKFAGYLDRSSLLSVEAIRATGRKVDPPDPSDQYGEWIDEDTLTDTLTAGFARLDRRHLFVVRGVLSGYGYEEIGAQLGVTASRVCQLMREARVDLAEILRAA